MEEKDDGMNTLCSERHRHSKRGYVNKSQAASVILFFVLTVQLKEEEKEKDKRERRL